MRDGLPYHQHKCFTKGYYRGPGDDVVYLKGCYYDSWWFTGTGIVDRGVITEFSSLLLLSLNDLGYREQDEISGPEISTGEEVSLVGSIKTLALDEAFLSDETLSRRWEASPVMVYLMRILKGLERLIVVRTEGEETWVEEIEAKIEEARTTFMFKCQLRGYEGEAEELRLWNCPALSVVSRRELGELCGEWEDKV